MYRTNHGNRRLALRAACLVAICAFTAGDVMASAPAGRYLFPSTGVVYDTVTKLTWQRTVTDTSVAWGADHCASLNLGGHTTGWRVPTVKELVSLVDYSALSPAIDQNAFPGAPVAVFWTSSPYAIPNGGSSAWLVSFDDGSLTALDTSTTDAAVRCVWK